MVDADIADKSYCMGKEQINISFKIIGSPIGELVAAATDDGLCLLEFIDSRDPLFVVQKTINNPGAVIRQQDHAHLIQTESELAEYFSGKRRMFSIPLVPFGTPFQQQVWQALQQVHYGKTNSYKQQALVLKNLLAIRAVAHANGSNPIAIIIPCHRIVGSNGSLTGYAGGLHRKKWLLDFEKQSTGQFNSLFPL